MQSTSVSETIVANSQPSSNADAARDAGTSAWRRRWRNFWATQRLYWRLTLLMLLAVLVTIGLLGLYWSPAGGTVLVIGWLTASFTLTALFVAALQINASQVRRVTYVLDRLAHGDYSARADLLAGSELNQLSRAVNRLAERTEHQAARRKRERDRFDTVLYNMSDGVIMLDRRGTVALMNPSAERLLHSPADKVLHESFVQIVRDYRLADVWQQCAQRREEQTATIEVSAGFFLRITVTPFLRGASNGYLVLLQDLSHLYRLEAVRRDFVSNISHELRTPLASIKALVDTLRDGAMSDPPAAEHFLGRMEIEVDSMTQMVQELLELSRIESGQAPLRLFPSGLAALVEPAVERLRPQAARADITLTVVPARRTAAGHGRRRPHPPGGDQPGAQRHQVHACRRLCHRDGARRARRHRRLRGRYRHRHSRPKTCRASLNAFTRQTAPVQAVAPALASPSPSTRSRRTMGVSGSRASRARAAPSPLRFPSLTHQ